MSLAHIIEDLDHLRTVLQEEKSAEHRWSNLELKSSWDSKYGKKISALANSRTEVSSWVVVGVDDQGSLLHRTEQWAKATEEQVSNSLNQYLDPHQACTGIHCMQVGKSWIVAVSACNPGAVVRWRQKAYKAIGTTIAEMSPEESMKLQISLPGLEDPSRQPSPVHLDTSLVDCFLRDVDHNGSDPDIELLRSKGLYERALTQLSIHNTVTARLLFDDYPFRVVEYDADDNVIRNDTFRGLFKLLSPPLRNNVLFGSDRAPSGLSSDLLRESIANAIAHADYNHRQGEIMIETWPGRLCISNWAARDSAYFANKWFSRGHYSQNPLLMETLRAGGFVDELGRGKVKILSEAIKEGLAPPRVDIEVTGIISRWRLNVYTHSDPNQVKLLKALTDHYNGQRQKAHMANAIILWTHYEDTSFRDYIDSDAEKVFKEIASDRDGPFIIYDENELPFLQRWVKVILTEGTATKQLTPAEELRLFRVLTRTAFRNAGGQLTPNDVRRFAGLGQSPAERSQCSRILKKWVESGKVKRIRRGLYKIQEPRPTQSEAELLSRYLRSS